MPGKPTLACVAENKLIIGAPGYPVSSVVCFEQILKPLIFWMLQVSIRQREKINVRLSRKLPSKLGLEEFVRLNIGEIDSTWVAAPLKRGAGLITSLTKAQGWARVPPHLEGLAQNETLEAELFGTREDLGKVIICIGSHDNTLDLLANELMGLEFPLTLSSTHVGSMGGITALKDNAAHICGCHLFDPKTQDFNFPFLKKYLPDQEVTVFNLSIRQQGLIVSKGNPKKISSIRDIKEKKLVFINRQRGAGTRVLFDDLLEKAGISAEEVNGYAQEEYTHMAVAVNVLSGTADCGLGIYAAAKALELDFIPVVKERYDLVIPTRLVEEPRIKTLISLLQSTEIKRKIESLGGYETWLTGKIMQPDQGLELR
jgi:putative molybdopterin biosynthesis protein